MQRVFSMVWFINTGDTTPSSVGKTSRGGVRTNTLQQNLIFVVVNLYSLIYYLLEHLIMKLCQDGRRTDVELIIISGDYRIIHNLDRTSLFILHDYRTV